jgi:hypothetical protein
MVAVSWSITRVKQGRKCPKYMQTKLNMKE